MLFSPASMIRLHSKLPDVCCACKRNQAVVSRSRCISKSARAPPPPAGSPAASSPTTATPTVQFLAPNSKLPDYVDVSKSGLLGRSASELDLALRFFSNGVRFLGSASEVRSSADTPFLSSDLPEVAVAGRSNVGKSTLLNAVMQKKLAVVSKMPVSNGGREI